MQQLQVVVFLFVCVFVLFLISYPFTIPILCMNDDVHLLSQFGMNKVCLIQCYLSQQKENADEIKDQAILIIKPVMSITSVTQTLRHIV